MAKKFQNKDFFAGDLFKDPIENAKLLIKEINEVERATVKLAQTNKAIVTKRDDKQTIESIRKKRSAQEQLNEVDRVSKKIATQKRNLSDKLRIANSGQAKAMAELNLQIQIQNKNNKQLVNENAKLVGTYKATSTRLVRLRKEYKDLALSEGTTSQKARELRAEILKLDVALKRVDRSVGQSQRNVGNYRSSFQRLGATLKTGLGFIGLTGLIFGLGRVIGGAFRRVREFDKEMNNMAGIAGVARKDLSLTEEQIIKVAGSSIKTSNEVAKLATTITALGKTQSEVRKLLAPINNLSIALGATSDEAGELLVGTLNAFGKGAEEGEKFADIIAKMRTSTSLDFERIKDSLGFIAPTANALNLTLGETGALIGTLVDNNVKASRAGRLLSSSFIKMAKEGKDLEGSLDRINAAQNRGAEGAELLRVAEKDFGIQSAALGLILANNREKTDELANAFDNLSEGALKELTDQQLESMDAKLKILDSTYEQFILHVADGEGVLGSMFKSAIEGATNFLSGIDKLSVGLTSLSKNAIGAREEYFAAVEGFALGFDGIGTELQRQNKFIEAETDRIADEFVDKDRKTQKLITANLLKRIKDDTKLLKTQAGLETLNTEKRINSNLILLRKLKEITIEKVEQNKEDEIAVGKAERLLGLIEKQAKIVSDTSKAVQEARSEDLILKIGIKLDVEKEELNRLKRIASSTLIEIDKIERDLIEDSTERRIAQEIARSEKLIQTIESNSRITIAVKERLIEEENRRLAKFVNDAEIKAGKQRIKNESDLSKAEFEQRRTGFKTQEAFEKEKAEQFRAIKKKELEDELALLQQFGGEETKVREEQLKAQIEGLNKFEDDTKKVAQELGKLIEVIGEEIDKMFEKRIEAIDKQIEKSGERIDDLRTKAAAGSLAAGESLAVERKREIELEKEKARERKKQEQSKALFAVLTSFSNNDGNIGKTVADVTVLKAIAGQLTGFWDGADDVGKSLGKPALSGKDGHIVKVDGSEQVWSKKDRGQVGNRSRSQIKGIVGMYDKGMMINPSKYDSSNELMSPDAFALNGMNIGMEKKLDEVNKSIKGIVMPETSMSADEMRNTLSIVTRFGNKKTKQVSKLFNR
jgi:hypothetical protein